MLYICLITIFACLQLHDRGFNALQVRGMPGWVGAAAVLAPCLVVMAWQWSFARRATSAVERSGSLRPIERLDVLTNFSRVVGCASVCVGVMALGWLKVVRDTLGDWVLLDEAVVVAPFMAVCLWGWWANYPLERLLREAVILRELDEGRPLQELPSRLSWVWMQVRHSLMLVLLPMTAIWAWGETLSFAANWAARRVEGTPDDAGWLAENLARLTGNPWVYEGLIVAGVLALICLIPSAIRRLWDTVPLRGGALAERLLLMCRREGVRVRGVYIWRTGGMVINGAVLGVLGRFRYILLTDGLLERMPWEQVEAVMAHEIAHVRKRHVPWLTGTLMAVGATTVAAAAGVDLALRRYGFGIPGGPGDLAVSAVSMVLAVLAFGYVSRRFEWQADAFAAAHVSRFGAGAEGTPTPDGATRMSAPGVAAMCNALDSVALLNHIPRERASFRHGSIDTRIRRLRMLQDLPLDQLPIDRTVRRIKFAVLSAAVLSLAAVVVMELAH